MPPNPQQPMQAARARAARPSVARPELSALQFRRSTIDGSGLGDAYILNISDRETDR